MRIKWQTEPRIHTAIEMIDSHGRKYKQSTQIKKSTYKRIKLKCATVHANLRLVPMKSQKEIHKKLPVVEKRDKQKHMQ